MGASRLVAALLFIGTAAACELQEITVIDFVDVVVAEVYVSIGETPADNTVTAFLHGATAGSGADSRTFDDAQVTVTRTDGFQLDLSVVQLDECLLDQPDGLVGTCFAGDPAQTPALSPGDALELSVALGDGGTLSGVTDVPGDFQLDGLGGACRLEPDTLMTVRWSRSDGAWAYLTETAIEGLTDALAPEGIVAEDSLHLVGLSISAADTTVVFPSEFGIFDRFDLEQDLAVRLQRGLPAGTMAAVSVTATDRNFVNWVRGGSFNPSGQVRLASLTGDGTGAFAAVVSRRFSAVSSADPALALPVCPLP